MSGGASCSIPREHRNAWRVVQRECNHSHFNGRRWTPSRYSEVKCPLCPALWRTKARYVATLKDDE